VWSLPSVIDWSSWPVIVYLVHGKTSQNAWETNIFRYSDYHKCTGALNTNIFNQDIPLLPHKEKAQKLLPVQVSGCCVSWVHPSDGKTWSNSHSTFQHIRRTPTGINQTELLDYFTQTRMYIRIHYVKAICQEPFTVGGDKLWKGDIYPLALLTN